MLVICCGMMRSGSTLQYQIVVELLQRSQRGTGIGEVRETTCAALLEAAAAQNQPGDQALKVHKLSHLADAAAAIAAGQAIGLYISRDVRDVAVSLMNMRRVDFETLLFQLGEVQQVLLDYAAWTQMPRMLISQYEPMMADLATEVRRIAAHLDIDLSPAAAQAIADTYDLKQQQRRIQAWQHSADYDASQHDPNSLLHHNHIKSGASQQWRQALQPMEIAYLEAIAGDWLVAQGYGLSQPAWRRRLSPLWYGRARWRRKWHHWRQQRSRQLQQADMGST